MSLIRRLCRDEGGTVIVLASVAMLVLLGSAALAVDVGVHAAQKRQVVTAVDAAALAGARHLPDDPAQAKAAAIDFAQRNGLTLEDSDISFENSNKRIVISAEKQVDTFLLEC
jgi:Flp pilus assembly protein TadG